MSESLSALVYDLLPRRSKFCFEKIVGKKFRNSLVGMYFCCLFFTFFFNQFVLISAMGYDYSCNFSFGITCCCNSLILIINKIILLSLKFESIRASENNFNVT